MRALMLKVSREELERELKARIDVAADLLLRTLDGGRYPVELSNASSSPSPNSDREPPKPLS
jgi:hypothetical protein